MTLIVVSGNDRIVELVVNVVLETEDATIEVNCGIRQWLGKWSP